MSGEIRRIKSEGGICEGMRLTGALLRVRFLNALGVDVAEVVSSRVSVSCVFVSGSIPRVRYASVWVSCPRAACAFFSAA